MARLAGYSGKSLASKLGLAPDQRIAFVAVPATVRETIGPLPSGARVLARVGSSLDLVLLCARRAAELDGALWKLTAALAPAGMLWIGWPKKSAGVTTDLTEDVVRRHGLAAGLVDVKVCAIDHVWSGLKFVRRLRDRPSTGSSRNP
jgi:hypothetical protein